MNPSLRRHDLDWLRVLVFSLLILYHSGMFFVPWGWHLKNNEIYDWLRWPMLFLNQWRLPILFVISGMGTAYALQKRSGWQFVGERFKRLFLPLAFGMAAIVPVQVYYERLARGQFPGGYFDFWPALAFEGVYPEGNLSWHHLWFLPYLLTYSVVLAPVFLYFRARPQAAFLRWARRLASHPAGIFWFIVPLYLLESLVEPFFEVRHNLTDDWFTFFNFLTLFFYGFVLVSVREAFWETVARNRRAYLYCGLLGFSLMVGLRLLFADSIVVHFTEAAFKVFNFWAWILCIFGYAAVYLNRPGKTLAYCNAAVYPFYILHQSVTIALAYYLKDLAWGFAPKFLVLSVGTFVICFVLYEGLIRRFMPLRPLFGMKLRKHTPDPLPVA